MADELKEFGPTMIAGPGELKCTVDDCIFIAGHKGPHGSYELGDSPGPLLPDFGKLGESVSGHERSRIGALVASGRVDPAAVPLKALGRTDVREVKTLVREVLGEVSEAVGNLKHDIDANTRLLKHIDVPLENISESHERAAHSFETLRGENEEMRQAIVRLAEAHNSLQQQFSTMQLLVGRIALKLDA